MSPQCLLWKGVFRGSSKRNFCGWKKCISGCWVGKCCRAHSLMAVGFACTLSSGQMALKGTFDLGRCLMVHFGGSLSHSQILPRLCKKVWECYSGSRVWRMSFGRGSPPKMYFVSLVSLFETYSILLCYCCCTISTAINWVFFLP